MRSDSSLPASFRSEDVWKIDPDTGVPAPEQERLTFFYGPDYHRHPYSGYERNKLFLNVEGADFADISGISGADSIADSRSWAAIDYDGDGWNDIALVNANTPLFNLYRNQIGADSDCGWIKVRLRGGAEDGGETREWSNRDAVGAVVEIRIGGRSLRRVRQLGEGFAAQNSATLTIGIGQAPSADSIEVTWPSGRSSMVEGPIPRGTALVIDERSQP